MFLDDSVNRLTVLS